MGAVSYYHQGKCHTRSPAGYPAGGGARGGGRAPSRMGTRLQPMHSEPPPAVIGLMHTQTRIPSCQGFRNDTMYLFITPAMVEETIEGGRQLISCQGC